MPHRKKLSVMGGIRSFTTRPTTALPAHNKGGTSSSKAVEGVIFCVMVGQKSDSATRACRGPYRNAWHSAGGLISRERLEQLMSQVYISLVDHQHLSIQAIGDRPRVHRAESAAAHQEANPIGLHQGHDHGRFGL